MIILSHIYLLLPPAGGRLVHRLILFAYITFTSCDICFIPFTASQKGGNTLGLTSMVTGGP